MRGLSAGLTEFKLFPAAGGRRHPPLAVPGRPLPEASFCPTGGINPDNLQDYLALPNVLCVGGSWMVAPNLIADQQWAKITALSQACMTPQPR